MIGFADRDGNNPGSFAVGSNPFAIAVDAQNGHVYWSELDANLIRRANLDGTNMVDIITGDDALGIALDVIRNKIYWVLDNNIVNGATKVRRANLNGSSIEDVVVISSSSFSLGLAFNVPNDKVYWTDFFSGSVKRANLNGTQVETIISGVPNITAVTVDTTNGKVYWTACLGQIQRADLDGNNIETVVSFDGDSPIPCPAGLSLDVPNGKLYWADQNGPVGRVNLDGMGKEILLSSIGGSPSHIALDEPPDQPTEAVLVPAVSEWGLVVLALLMLVAGTLSASRALRRREEISPF